MVWQFTAVETATRAEVVDLVVEQHAAQAAVALVDRACIRFAAMGVGVAGLLIDLGHASNRPTVPRRRRRTRPRPHPRAAARRTTTPCANASTPPSSRSSGPRSAASTSPRSDTRRPAAELDRAVQNAPQKPSPPHAGASAVESSQQTSEHACRSFPQLRSRATRRQESVEIVVEPGAAGSPQDRVAPPRGADIDSLAAAECETCSYKEAAQPPGGLGRVDHDRGGASFFGLPAGVRSRRR